jgi:hypothetical protein
VIRGEDTNNPTNTSGGNREEELIVGELHRTMIGFILGSVLFMAGMVGFNEGLARGWFSRHS